MGLLDKAKELADQAKDKAGELAEKAGPGAAKGLDAAKERIDKATGGKYHDQIESVAGKVGGVLNTGNGNSTDEEPSAGEQPTKDKSAKDDGSGESGTGPKS